MNSSRKAVAPKARYNPFLQVLFRDNEWASLWIRLIRRKNPFFQPSVATRKVEVGAVNQHGAHKLLLSADFEYNQAIIVKRAHITAGGSAHCGRITTDFSTQNPQDFDLSLCISHLNNVENGTTGAR
jgi:hypothetical protein